MSTFDLPPPDYNKNKLRREADFVVKKIEIVAFNGNAYDVTTMRKELNIYESIFENAISGSISLVDSVDLPTLLPIIGGEKIRIIFTRPDLEDDIDSPLSEINVEYRIYKLDERKQIGERTQAYRLYFISEEFFRSQKSKVQKSFRNQLFSDMVKDCFDEFIFMNKPIVIEPTRYPQNFIAGNITPYNFFNLVASSSISAEGNGSGYLFYEDREQFNFVSLGKLFEQEPSETYFYQMMNALKNEAGNGWKPQNIEVNIRSAEKYIWRSSFDCLNNIGQGMYGSSTTVFDPIRQVIQKKDFNYFDEFDKFKHLGKSIIHTDEFRELFGSDSLNNLVFSYLDHANIERLGPDEDLLPTFIEEHLPYRQSQFRQIRNRVIQMSVSGDPRRKVGQIIEFRLPDSRGKTNETTPQEEDKYLNGKYLIVGLRKQLLADSYYMQMELIKDSFSSDIEHVNPIEEYKDIY